MPTLLMCFDAPMQSWGIRSRFASRDTATEPTKSGVVGLLAAALGIPQDADEEIRNLASLRMGVRVDREGVLESDFHTVQNVPNTEGKNHRTAVSKRFYLTDALFLVALESEDRHLLHQLLNALHRPHWPLYFGRKAFPPARPLPTQGLPSEHQPVTAQPLDHALRTHPWLENQPRIRNRHQPTSEDTSPTWLRTVIDADPLALDVELRHDHPLSFHPQQRSYASRAVQVDHVPLTPEMINSHTASPSSAPGPASTTDRNKT